MGPEVMSLTTALVAGLLGGVHCLGMCGGIVGALTLGLERQSGGGTRSVWPFLLAYNTGRVLSYAAAGAVMGGLGAVVLKLAPAQVMQTFLLLAAGVFMVLLGLSLGGWWRILVRVERLGRPLSSACCGGGSPAGWFTPCLSGRSPRAERRRGP